MKYKKPRILKSNKPARYIKAKGSTRRNFMSILLAAPSYVETYGDVVGSAESGFELGTELLVRVFGAIVFV